MKKICLIFSLALSLSACATAQGLGRKNGFGLQRAFYKEKAEVWAALQLVFKKYPKKTVEEETGLIETGFLRYGRLYPPLSLKEDKKRTWRYAIKVSLTSEDDPESPVTYVLIQKTIQSQRDFFAAPEERPSDFLEEEALMYRLQRELQIKRLVKKLFNNPDK